VARPKVPDTTVSLLTETSKMPCKSWSLPAKDACPYAVYGPGTICGSCYAAKGMYVWACVQQAQQTRFAWVRESLKTTEGRDAFVSHMVAAIRAERKPYFRIHDSGDFFNRAYVECWQRIARALPEVKFWAPTRAWQTRNPWRDALVDLAALPNVTVRPSALFFDAPPPRIDGFAAGTTATTGGFSCPASLQGGECRDCRVCWDEPDREVSYHKH